MDETELWNIFKNSGKITDYLNYKQIEVSGENVIEHNGACNSGADTERKRQNNINSD